MREKTDVVSVRLNSRHLTKIKTFAELFGMSEVHVIRNMIEHAEIASLPVIATSVKKEGDAPADQAVCVTFA